MSSILTSALSGDAADAGAILGSKDSTVPEDIRWARAVAKAFEEHAEDEVNTAHRLRNSLTEIDMLFPGEGGQLLPDADVQTLAEALRSERFFERLADVRALNRAANERAQARYAELRREMGASLRVMAATLEAHPDWPLLLDDDRTAIIQKLQATLPLQPAGADPVNELKTLLVRRNGLAGLLATLEAEIARRALAPPAAPMGVEVEVAQVPLVELRPPAVIPSQAELEDWLSKLRVRLSAMLRASKHNRIE